jgi:cbb3-type cytochrome oxidase subunit 3
MMSAFLKRTAFAILLLFLVCGIAWFYSPHRHFVGVLTICYGFLIGWIAAWFSMYRYSHRQPG